MRRSTVAAAFAALAVLASAAAHAADPNTEPSSQTEAEVMLPNGLATGQSLIAIKVPGSSLQFGIDSTSIVRGADGVTRYVVIATSSSGALNAMHEGIRCASGEVKTYARYNAGSGWTRTQAPTWQLLTQAGGVRHSLAIARSGLCVNAVRSVDQIIRDLRSPQDPRLNYELR